MHKMGLGISYNEVLVSRNFKVVNDLKRSMNCSFEPFEGKPAIVIMNNEDFKSDTLTGAGQPHRTKVMFVQQETFDHDSEEAGRAIN